MRKDSPYYIPSINVLQGANLFKGVNQELIEEILSYLTPMTLPKKSIIPFWQTKESLFVIIKGRVKISEICPQTGREYIIYFLEKGDVFDVITLLDEEEHEVIIETVDEVELLKTSIHIARDWLNIHPQFNKNFFPYIGKRMRHLENSAADLVFYDTITRLAKLILRYIDKKSNQLDGEYSLRLINDLSHETLSQMIGSVRKVVNLNIQELNKEGILDTKRGKFAIKNLEKLSQKAKEIISF